MIRRAHGARYLHVLSRHSYILYIGRYAHLCVLLAVVIACKGACPAVVLRSYHVTRLAKLNNSLSLITGVN